MKGLWRRRFPALKAEAEVLQAAETRDRLRKNNIDLFIGEAALIEPTVGQQAHFTDDDDKTPPW